MGDRNEYKRRQKLMHDAGFATKTDGSWGSWHENLWLNYLKDKHPVTTFITDNIAQPIANGIGAILGNAVESGKPVQEAVKNKEHHRLPLTTFNSAMGIGFSPISTAMGLTSVGKYLGYLDPTHTRALFNMDKLINDPNYKYLELDYSDISPFLNDALTTTSYLPYSGVFKPVRKLAAQSAGKATRAVAKHNKPLQKLVDKHDEIKSNYSQLGRYTLNTLYPASYPTSFWRPGSAGKLSRELLKTLATLPFRPLFLKPPTFTNGKRPLWYQRFADIYGSENAEGRFINGEKWAGIEDVPTSKMYTLNEDGKTYSLTPDFLKDDDLVTLDLKTANHKGYRAAIQDADYLTEGLVGGLHSDYYLNKKTLHVNKDGNLAGSGTFVDEQKLNPLWIPSFFLKKLVPFKKSKPGQKITAKLNRWGGKDMSYLLGYKPFKIKQNIDFTSDGSGVMTVSPTKPKITITPKENKFNWDDVEYADFEEIF